MQVKHEQRLPWREREFVSIADAALIIGRSRTWIENKITEGCLDAHCFYGCGPALVTVASLKRLVDTAKPVPLQCFAAPTRPTLRLVVDNA